MKATIFRIALSLVLLYFVFPETGWATTLVLFLVMLNNEITATVINKKAWK